MSDILGLDPPDLGLPPKFTRWRPGQEEAIQTILDSDKRFVALSVPTGGGKSPIYVAAAILNNQRAVCLTSTKGLQTQLLADFASVGMVDVRGRANYPCQMAEGLDCEDGSNAHCPHVRLDTADLRHRCPYAVAYTQAVRSRLVVTNYVYWALVHRFAKGLGPTSMLVLDEAHSAPDEVCGVMSVHLSQRDIVRLRTRFPAESATTEQWAQWAARHIDQAARILEGLNGQLKQGHASHSLIKEVKHARGLCRSLDTIASAGGPWEWEPVPDRQGGGYRLEPLWASEYADQVLFRGVRKVVLVSATLTQQTLSMLGIDADDCEFAEFPSTFPSSRTPVYYYPVCSVSHDWGVKGTDNGAENERTENQMEWLRTMDEFIGARLDRKGIIHGVSYDRSRLILKHSAHRRHMVTHDPGSNAAMQQVELFKATPPPRIMVSPALTMGYDFPLDTCEYQIIAKVPFPDRSGRLMRARLALDIPRRSRDPEHVAARKRGTQYGDYLTAQSLVQACGRSTRSREDQSEILIVDRNFGWLYRGSTAMFPIWFRRLLIRRSQSDPLPKPLKKLPVTAVCSIPSNGRPQTQTTQET
jgi:Rad3-related DNA helicase